MPMCLHPPADGGVTSRPDAVISLIPQPTLYASLSPHGDQTGEDALATSNFEGTTRFV